MIFSLDISLCVHGLFLDAFVVGRFWLSTLFTVKRAKKTSCYLLMMINQVLLHFKVAAKLWLIDKKASM